MVGSFAPDAGVRAASADIADRLTARGWRVLRVSARRGRIARLADMLCTTFRHRNAYAVAQLDVFSGRAFVWAEAVAWLLRRLSKPYVLTLRGGALPKFAQQRPRRARALLGSAAAVVAPSRYLQEAMRPYRADVQVVPNGIDIAASRFRLREHPRGQLIWLRAFHDIYDPALAPAVLAALGPGFEDVRLTMIGPDKGDGSLQRTRDAARALGVVDRVVIAGAVPKPEIPAMFEGADILLNTARVDNTPVTLLEALAAGLCVVSTRVGGIPWLVNDGVDALLVPPSDPGAMAAAVRRILVEPELAARLSAAGRLRVADFDWSAVLPVWERILTSASRP
jgi:glycosyltransferase involved in cell wall biosynthesis